MSEPRDPHEPAILADAPQLTPSERLAERTAVIGSTEPDLRDITAAQCHRHQDLMAKWLRLRTELGLQP